VEYIISTYTHLEVENICCEFNQRAKPKTKIAGINTSDFIPIKGQTKAI